MKKELSLIVLSFILIVSFIPVDVFGRKEFKRDDTCLYNLCNATNGYPSELIAQIAEKYHKYSNLFGNVVAPYKKIELKNRFNYLENENMCSTRPIIMFPTKGKDIYERWNTIVNVEGYRQSVSFEACVENSSCFAEGKLPLGYTTSCQQQYITVRMVVLKESEELAIEKILIPSGCACVYSLENYK